MTAFSRSFCLHSGPKCPGLLVRSVFESTFSGSELWTVLDPKCPVPGKTMHSVQVFRRRRTMPCCQRAPRLRPDRALQLGCWSGRSQPSRRRCWSRPQWWNLYRVLQTPSRPTQRLTQQHDTQHIFNFIHHINHGIHKRVNHSWTANRSHWLQTLLLFLGLIVIRFSMPQNFFTSQPIVIKLSIQIGDNILYNHTESHFQFKS